MQHILLDLYILDWTVSEFDLNSSKVDKLRFLKVDNSYHFLPHQNIAFLQKYRSTFPKTRGKSNAMLYPDLSGILRYFCMISYLLMMLNRCIIFPHLAINYGEHYPISMILCEWTTSSSTNQISVFPITLFRSNMLIPVQCLLHESNWNQKSHNQHGIISRSIDPLQIATLKFISSVSSASLSIYVYLCTQCLNVIWIYVTKNK